jgi:hypothetical protein
VTGLRAIAPDLLGVAGFGLVLAGVAQLSRAAALVVAGLVLVGAGARLAWLERHPRGVRARRPGR